MKILITGSTGLLGQALRRQLRAAHDVTGLSRCAGGASGAHIACDLVDARRTAEVVRSLKPEIVIHAQAMVDVDRCEREPGQAHEQNVRTTEHLVRALEGTDALLVHVSTDYVFDGTKGSPYRESDEPHPINVYGRSKLESERVALQHPRGVVARTSTLFGPDRMNFCDYVVLQVRAGQPVDAFADQVTSPTYTADLAEGIGDLSEALWKHWKATHPRVYHIANSGGCSRVAFSERIAERLGGSRGLIRKISRADRQRAPRPAYSSLDVTQLPLIIGRTLRPWDEALDAYLRQRRWLN